MPVVLQGELPGGGAARRPADGAAVVVPGTLVAVDGEGVLIRGEAGTGKSETALGLLDRGHRLVADDAVQLSGGAGAPLHGEAPPLLAGRLALRGLGVVDVLRLFGASALAPYAPVTLVAWLREGADANPLHGAWERTDLLGVPVPTVTLRPGRLLPLLIETALRQQLAGGDAAAALIRQQTPGIDP